ncbi:MAG: hypothetical protein ACFB20_00555 [Opitutales bacterium]
MNTGLPEIRAALDTKGDPASWEQMLASIRESLAIARLTPKDVGLLLRGCHEPAELAALARLLSRHPLRHPGDAGPMMRVRDAAEHHSYPVTSWIGGLAVVQTWIQARSIDAELDKLLGYVSCCAEAGDAKPARPDLRDEVAGMLATFGFEG